MDERMGRCEWMGLWNKGRKERNLDKGKMKGWVEGRKDFVKYNHKKEERTDGFQEGMKDGWVKIWMYGLMEEKLCMEGQMKEERKDEV